MTGLQWPRCQFYTTPDAEEQETFKITDPDIVLGCPDQQGEGPLYFFVPVEGGAVRVPVCPRHAAHLGRLYGKEAPGDPG